jgi:hypothetical protein
MPVKKVRTKKGTGYRWGQTGKIYYGPNAKERAERQGRAIRASGYTG